LVKIDLKPECLNFLANGFHVVQGGTLLLTTTLLAVAPRAADWSPVVGLIMIVCNVLAIAFAKYTIKHAKAGPATPSPEMFGGFGVPAVIGTTCFGHILGAGVILGLSNMGVL
jgi:photosystem I subunit X